MFYYFFRHCGLLCSIVLSTIVPSFAQATPDSSSPSLNIIDAMGRKDGLWYTQSKPAFGEPGIIVLGNYDHGKKTGLWYTSDDIGNMISIESYKHDVRDGESKYFEGGKLSAVGHYRGLNPSELLDTFMIVHPETEEQKWVAVPFDRGSVRHGSWRFYDPISGRLIKEEYYQMDLLITQKEFLMTAADSVYYKNRNRFLPHENNGKSNLNIKGKKIPKSLIGN
jgi:hypothetical protein